MDGVPGGRVRASARKMVMLLAVGGVGACCAALVHFLFAIMNNDLPWTHGQSAREHYLAVGHSYTQGFVVGFFLCFFLSIAAVAIGAWQTQREAGIEPYRSLAGASERP